MSIENNPFQELSNLFIDNQRMINVKTDEVLKKSKSIQQKMTNLIQSVEQDVFASDLMSIVNIPDESRLLLTAVKELEIQRDQIINSINILKKSKERKLNN
jgi:hypothetical protein|tara:strand:+ start:11081 stop:11383 length:303 start_codon:yes stop_codon:yes gene_type:complete